MKRQTAINNDPTNRLFCVTDAAGTVYTMRSTVRGRPCIQTYFDDKKKAKRFRDSIKSAAVRIARGPDHPRGSTL